ncbi:ABC transporter substrate-binding protein [Sagittula sp. MA-2]|jgi:peptide/nickel transport system substrate-binding protein|uniref:ABC transporter substrate-binding protein n=1 Tax=Sagittula sp. MA-2 TaxID=3048007 RepID=UPI0024C2CDA6|nr:ABC transporter substrate-binding protein [Sagittula sp. MA-2]WHZ37842.1 ABC transporter substrate-binding protein [Sagittula sp. MA-2]
MIRNRTGLVSACLIAAAPLLAGTALADKSDDTMRVAFTEDIINLDYNFTTKREYIIISELIDETLLAINPSDGSYAPALASDYTQVDPVTLDVTLRQGIVFHDGTEMTAEDVAYTYNTVASGESQSLSGARIEVWFDRAEVLEPYKVRFHFKQQYPLALQDMAIRVPIRKAGTYGTDGTIDVNAASGGPVGLGPYKVTSFEPGDELVLERFADYYDGSPKGDPSIGTIVIRSLPDEGTQQAELISGSIDWIYDVPRDVAENLGNMPQVKHLSGPDRRIGFLILDAGGLAEPDGPLTDVKVRRAVAHAIDREEIAAALIGGAAAAIDGACHPSELGCNQQVTTYEYDPEKARQLLAEAGYEDGFEMELWGYRDKPMGEAIVADLNEVGIDATLRQVKLDSLNVARANRQISSYFGTWGGDTAPPIRQHFDPDSDRNLSGDAELAQMVTDAYVSLDADEQADLFAKIHARITDQVYWVPLWSYSVNYLTDPDLDFPTDDDGFPRLYKASWGE